MHKVLDPRDDLDRIYVLGKQEEKELLAFKIALMHWYNDSKTTWKVWRKIDHSHQKQYRHQKHQQNKNNQE